MGFVISRAFPAFQNKNAKKKLEISPITLFWTPVPGDITETHNPFPQSSHVTGRPLEKKKSIFHFGSRNYATGQVVVAEYNVRPLRLSAYTTSMGHIVTRCACSA